MALKKVRKPEETSTITETNDGFDVMFSNSRGTDQIYNGSISNLKHNNDTDCEEIHDTKNIEEDSEKQRPIIYESKQDVSPIIRTSKTDCELKKYLIAEMDWNKVLIPLEYPGTVIDVSIEEVKRPESKEYKRVRFDLEVMNDDPVEPVTMGLTAGLNFNYNSKLSRIVRAILGCEITGEFNLENLIGEKIIVKTKEVTDRYGNRKHAVDTIRKA